MATKSAADAFMLDFSKEEKVEGINPRVKEGTYRVKLGKPKPAKSNSGTYGLRVPCKILDGRHKGKVITETLWLSPKALGRFRDLLEACGKRVPSKIDVRRIAKAVEGCEIYIQIEDQKSEGYATKSAVAFAGGFISPEDYEPDEDGEESEDALDDDDDLEEDDDEDLDDDPPAKRTKSRKPAEPEEDDEDDLDGLDLDDFDD